MLNGIILVGDGDRCITLGINLNVYLLKIKGTYRGN